MKKVLVILAVLAMAACGGAARSSGGGGKAPPRLPARRIRRNMRGEIRREHEGRDQREIGLARRP